MDTLYIYTRVSTSQQAEKGHSLEAQRKAGIEKAKKLNMNYKIFVEPAKSAANEEISNRPELQELLKLIENNTAKNIFVIEDSRLARNLTVSNIIATMFIKYQCVLYTQYDRTDYGNIDYQTKFRKNLNALLSVLENDQRVERSKRGKLEAVKKGKWGGAMCPYGFAVDEENYLIVNKEELIWYKKMIELSLKGNGVAKIAQFLNESGVKTKASSFYKKGMRITDKHTKKERFIDKNKFIWKPNTVLSILKNPIYKGERIFNGEKIKCLSLIDVNLWQTVQENLVKNRINSPRHNVKHFYLLRNLLVCNRCGQSLLGYIKPKEGMRVYYCGSKRRDPTPHFCGMKSINIDKLNELVWDNLMYVLTNGDIARRELKRIFSKTEIDKVKIDNENKSISNKMLDIELQKKNLIRFTSQGTITEEDLQKQLIDIENEIFELQCVINSNQRKIEISNNQKCAFSWILEAEKEAKRIVNTTDNETKRDIVNRFIDKIFVDYLDNEKIHVIELKLKYNIFNDETDTMSFLLDSNDQSYNVSEEKETSIELSKNEIQELEFDGDSSPIVTESEMPH